MNTAFGTALQGEDQACLQILTIMTHSGREWNSNYVYVFTARPIERPFQSPTVSIAKHLKQIGMIYKVYKGKSLFIWSMPVAHTLYKGHVKH